jgi:hypothetical protein
MDKTNNNFGNTRKGFEETANINIDKEVSELIKKGADKASINELRKKFGDDKLFDMVQEAYFERLALIRKRSIKFTKLIERKYGMYGYPLHVILNKALKYKDKYNLSEEEFELFRQYYQKSLNMRNNVNKYDVLIPNTNMAKVFGDDPYTNAKIHVNDSDHKTIKEIITLYDINRASWKNVILQSITYDLKSITITKPSTSQDTRVINYSSFIHPVIAAMFLPKIARFDEYFLFTNLAYVVKSKYVGEPITTYHSYLMLYNLVTDPTDVVCSVDSPLKDILNRIIVQVTLWKNVLRLRQGGFYDTYNSFVASDFMSHIDNCKLSTYDAPDLMMIGDENVIIRRLLSSLAFRCATIYSVPTTIPIFNPPGQNPHLQVSTINIPVNFTQVTKVPMIYIRLPNIGMQMTNNKQRIDTQSALSTVQPIMYNGKLETRMMSVFRTDGVLIVSIPRRTYRPMSANIYNLPAIFNFANMPHHAFGLEVLNDTNVYNNYMLTIGQNNKKNEYANKLFIKSIVTLKEKQDAKSNFIYGSKTFIFEYSNRCIYAYDPVYDQTIKNNNNFEALRKLDEYDKEDDFIKRQTILIYTEQEGNNSDVGSGASEEADSISKQVYKDMLDNAKNYSEDKDKDRSLDPLLPKIFIGYREEKEEDKPFESEYFECNDEAHGRKIASDKLFSKLKAMDTKTSDTKSDDTKSDDIKFGDINTQDELMKLFEQLLNPDFDPSKLRLPPIAGGAYKSQNDYKRIMNDIIECLKALNNAKDNFDNDSEHKIIKYTFYNTIKLLATVIKRNDFNYSKFIHITELTKKFNEARDIKDIENFNNIVKNLDTKIMNDYNQFQTLIENVKNNVQRHKPLLNNIKADLNNRTKTYRDANLQANISSLMTNLTADYLDLNVIKKNIKNYKNQYHTILKLLDNIKNVKNIINELLKVLNRVDKQKLNQSFEHNFTNSQKTVIEQVQRDLNTYLTSIIDAKKTLNMFQRTWNDATNQFVYNANITNTYNFAGRNYDLTQSTALGAGDFEDFVISFNNKIDNINELHSNLENIEELYKDVYKILSLNIPQEIINIHNDYNNHLSNWGRVHKVDLLAKLSLTEEPDSNFIGGSYKRSKELEKLKELYASL